MKNTGYFDTRFTFPCSGFRFTDAVKVMSCPHSYLAMLPEQGDVEDHGRRRAHENLDGSEPFIRRHDACHRGPQEESKGVELGIRVLYPQHTG